MPLEIWIALALAAAAAVLAVLAWLRRRHRAATPKPERNVYPLW